MNKLFPIKEAVDPNLRAEDFQNKNHVETTEMIINLSPVNNRMSPDSEDGKIHEMVIGEEEITGENQDDNEEESSCEEGTSIVVLVLLRGWRLVTDINKLKYMFLNFRQ